jgi:hypothetical protein
MDIQTATEIVPQLLRIQSELNGTLALIRDRCPSEEFLRNRAAFATIMGDIYLEVLRPIFAEHPNLEPKELRYPTSE